MIGSRAAETGCVRRPQSDWALHVCDVTPRYQDLSEFIWHHDVTHLNQTEEYSLISALGSVTSDLSWTPVAAGHAWQTLLEKQSPWQHQQDTPWCRVDVIIDPWCKHGTTDESVCVENYSGAFDSPSMWPSCWILAENARLAGHGNILL